MKKGMLAFASLMMVFTFVAPVSAAPDYKVKVTVNQTLIQSDVKPYIDQKKSRTYVPIRFISKALGESIHWDKKKKTVNIQKRDGKTIVLKKGQKFAYVNGKKQALDAPSVEHKNRIMVPLRFVSEQIGAIVEVTKQNKWTVVDIYYPDAPEPSPAQKPVKHTKSPKKAETVKEGRYKPFELDPKYNKLASHLFKDNFRVENGEFIFTVPNMKRSGANIEDFGKETKFEKGKEYRFKLGGNRYLEFWYAHPDETIEPYYVYLSPSHRHLDGQFDNIQDDVIVVCGHMGSKETADPLSKIVQNY